MHLVARSDHQRDINKHREHHLVAGRVLEYG
jgi:hypothetical protein